VWWLEQDGGELRLIALVSRERRPRQKKLPTSTHRDALVRHGFSSRFICPLEEAFCRGRGFENFEWRELKPPDTSGMSG
jgi:hypothetical protein